MKNYRKRMSIMSFDTQKVMSRSQTPSEISVDEFDSEVESKNQVIIKKQRKCFMIQSRSKLRIRWDLFVMLLATWNLFYVPYSVAFDSYIFSPLVADIMNWFIDIFFMLDILVNFRTTILNESTGEEI